MNTIAMGGRSESLYTLYTYETVYLSDDVLLARYSAFISPQSTFL